MPVLGVAGTRAARRPLDLIGNPKPVGITLQKSQQDVVDGRS